MQSLRKIFSRISDVSGARFNRYYGDVVKAGVGYPTADEARRDMVNREQSLNRFTWVR